MRRSGVMCVAMAAGAVFAASAVAGPDPDRSRPQRPVGNNLSADGPGFSDNFDSYPNGTPIVGQNGWLYWGATGQVDATADNLLAASAPNSALAANETDIVQVFNITQGQWQAKVKTYVPSSAFGVGFFIMLNTYANPYVSGGNWSIEVHYDMNLGVVESFNKSVANGGPGNTQLPLILDQWVELVIDIDLDTDTFNMTYGGQALVTNGQWSWNASGTQGQPRIQCIDLYSQMAGFRWDDVSLLPVGGPVTCYANCDESTQAPILNVADFTCFLTRFASGDSYANCDQSTQAPVLNVADFTCFLQSFAAGCP